MDSDRFVPVLLVLLVLGGTVGGCLKCANGCDDGYSDGDRAGTVCKFSRKGVVWKSWEGELNLGGMSTDANGHMVVNVWQFTVVDPAMIAKVQSAVASGHRVRMHYRQWWNSPLWMDSDYVITDVTEGGREPTTGGTER